MKFNTGVHSIKWEFGYWATVVDRWYAEGLPNGNIRAFRQGSARPAPSCTPRPGTRFPASRLAKSRDGGRAVWPTQGFPDRPRRARLLGMDHPQILVDVNLLFHPMFDVQVPRRTTRNTSLPARGRVQRRFIKATRHCPPSRSTRSPTGQTGAAQGRAPESQRHKGRFPSNWSQLVDWEPEPRLPARHRRVSARLFARWPT